MSRGYIDCRRLNCLAGVQGEPDRRPAPAHAGEDRRRWRPWTELTKRGAYDLRITAPDLQVNDVHHLAHVLASGKYE